MRSSIDSEGRDAQAREESGEAVGQHRPVTAFHELGHLFANEGSIHLGRGVGPSGELAVSRYLGPVRVVGLGRYAVGA